MWKGSKITTLIALENLENENGLSRNNKKVNLDKLERTDLAKLSKLCQWRGVKIGLGQGPTADLEGELHAAQSVFLPAPVCSPLYRVAQTDCSKGRHRHRARASSIPSDAVAPQGADSSSCTDICPDISWQPKGDTTASLLQPDHLQITSSQTPSFRSTIAVSGPSIAIWRWALLFSLPRCFWVCHHSQFHFISDVTTSIERVWPYCRKELYWISRVENQYLNGIITNAIVCKWNN